MSEQQRLLEAKLVRAAISHPEQLAEISLRAQPGRNFTDPAMLALFDAAKSYALRGEAPDIVEVVEHAAKYDEVGAQSILSAGQVVAAQSPPDLPRIGPISDAVALEGKRCRIRSELGVIDAELHHASDPDRVLAEFARRHQDDQQVVALRTLAECAVEVADSMQRDFESGETSILKTGLSWLDARLRISRSAFVIFGAREKTGKTWAVQNMALSMAANGKRIGWISTEMDIFDIVTRVAATHGGQHWLLSRDPQNLEEISNIRALRNDPAINNITFATEHDAEQLLRQMELLANKHRTECIFVDYLQDFTIPSSFGESYEGMAFFFRQLKSFAQRHRIPVIGISSVRKPQNDHAANAFPQVSQLFGSVKLIFAADAVVLMHRPNMNVPDVLEFRIPIARNSADRTAWYMRRTPSFELEGLRGDEAARLLGRDT